jgi:hypothetical protein
VSISKDARLYRSATRPEYQLYSFGNFKNKLPKAGIIIVFWPPFAETAVAG